MMSAYDKAENTHENKCPKDNTANVNLLPYLGHKFKT